MAWIKSERNSNQASKNQGAQVKQGDRNETQSLKDDNDICRIKRRTRTCSSSTKSILSSSSFLFISLIILLFLTPIVKSQFGNIFEQLFRQESHHEDDDDHDHDHHQRMMNSDPSKKNSGSFNQFIKLRDHTMCSQYLCPSTLDCVSNPNECPCPFVEDIKCPIVIPSTSNNNKLSSSFICTRAPGCSKVQKALELGS